MTAQDVSIFILFTGLGIHNGFQRASSVWVSPSCSIAFWKCFEDMPGNKARQSQEADVAMIMQAMQPCYLALTLSGNLRGLLEFEICNAMV